MRTQVGIVGAGPAGLLLSLLLQRDGIDCVVLESRSRAYVESRVRAGVLEQGTVDLMAELGAADRLRRESMPDARLDVRFSGGTISMDLPFAQKRWCGAAGVTHVKTLSDFRDHSFSQNYGVMVKEGPLAGLTARAVFVVGKDGKVKHVEYVKEITTEPSYDAALSAAKQAAGA